MFLAKFPQFLQTSPDFAKNQVGPSAGALKHLTSSEPAAHLESQSKRQPATASTRSHGAPMNYLGSDVTFSLWNDWNEQPGRPTVCCAILQDLSYRMLQVYLLGVEVSPCLVMSPALRKVPGTTSAQWCLVKRSQHVLKFSLILLAGWF